MHGHRVPVQSLPSMIMVLFVLGFREFLRTDGGDARPAGPCRISRKPTNGVSALAVSWSSALFLNDDSSLTLNGFINGISNEEKTLFDGETSSLQSVHLTEGKLYLVCEEGKLKVLDFASWECSDVKSESMPKLKIIDGFQTNEDSPLHGVTEKGELYRIDRDVIPTWIPMLLKITKISCGISHSMALAENGTVYTWGTGSRGQLGHGSLQDEKKPKLVEILCGVIITSVAAGGWHSVALADTGDLYIWGWNESGQLGFLAPDDSPNTSTKPSTLLQNVAKSKTDAVAMLSSPALLELEGFTECDGYVIVTDVSCGTRHTAAVIKNGKAMTWGWAKYGQLGHGCCILCTAERDADSSEPTRDPKRQKVEIPDVDATPCPSCERTPHLPGFVEYFKKRMINVIAVRCGPWNTFFNVE